MKNSIRNTENNTALTFQCTYSILLLLLHFFFFLLFFFLTCFLILVFLWNNFKPYKKSEGLDLKNTFWIGCTLPQNGHGLDLSISSSPSFSLDVLSSGISEPSGANPESEFVSLSNSFPTHLFPLSPVNPHHHRSDLLFSPDLLTFS